MLLVVLCLSAVRSAAAQTVEVGVDLAGACFASDGSACGSATHLLIGGRVSWWVTDRAELMARAGRVGRPSLHFEEVFPVATNVSVTDRSRTFLSGLWIYHFRRDPTVRPMFGIGGGVAANAQRVTCRPIACDGFPGLPPEGARRRWNPDLVMTLGLSGVAGDRWSWRVGCLSHALGSDSNGTIEIFAGLGVRLRRR